MPTGTGKTDTMIAVLVSTRCRRLLVVAPTDALRTQLSEKFLTLGVLRLPATRLLTQSALTPVVSTLEHIPKSPAELLEIISPAHVIVTTSAIAGACAAVVQSAFGDLCSHLFIDEAHHAEAPTWRAFRQRFATGRVLQFTATPFREDGKPIEGKLIYSYPLRKAQSEGYFKPIRFRRVTEFDTKRADVAIAKAAIAQLREDFSKGHILMARVGSVARAKQVAAIYKEIAPDIEIVELHTGIKASQKRASAKQRLTDKLARVVVCVDMLGEGFDLPELKIAAFHEIRKSLAVTLQLAGRFTRSRRDLGDATFIANTADVNVRDELRKLYARDPDWNVLLPQLSDGLVQDQQSLKDFLSGFPELASEIPLTALRPALSTVVYRTDCTEWLVDQIRSGIPNVTSCERFHLSVNEKERTAVVVVARRSALPWAEADAIYSWTWELYVLFWWEERALLFINGSTNAGDFSRLAQAVAGDSALLIKGQEVFRSFSGIKRLSLNSVGLSEQLGRNVSYTSRMGSDVARGLASAQRGKAQKSNLSGAGFEAGAVTSIGASRKGRIWSHRRGRVHQLVDWCKRVGTKLLDPTIDPDVVLKGTLTPSVVVAPPQIMPIGVDWPETIYESIEAGWFFAFGGANLHLSEVNLQLREPDPSGRIDIEIVGQDVRAILRLEIFPTQGTSDFRFSLVEGPSMEVVFADTPQPIAEFFTNNPPKVWYADGSSLEGNEHTPLKTDLPPYPKEHLVTGWDWTGTDLRRESQGEAKDPASIQAAVISYLKSTGSDLVFDDDGPGEVADVVAARIRGTLDVPTELEIEFYHCKFSQRSQPGSRVADLYVVCGQAQTSIRWLHSSDKRTDLFTHLLRREDARRRKTASSRIEVGSWDLLERLRECSQTTRVSLKIVVVQPGVSAATISDTQLRLLSVTENYLYETYQVPFEVVVSE